MSYIDQTTQAIRTFIEYMNSLSLPDGSNPGTRVLKSASVVTVPAAVKIEDTTGSYIATVKAPSTAATATDNAIVVAISPNNPVAISTATGAFAPIQRTPSYAVTSSAGTVATGSRSVSVFNSGTASGTWLGGSLPSGVQLTYEAGGQSDTLGSFAYSATGTTFIITTVV
jgi:hypothetical protein